MYEKTTSANYLKFGKVTNSFKTQKTLLTKEYIESNDCVQFAHSFNHNVYIEILEGMAILKIAHDPNIDDFESFAIHRSIRINSGNYFAIVPIKDTIRFRMYVPQSAKHIHIKLDKPIPYNRVKPTFSIEEILAYYYVVKMPKYVFPGEKHRFYELTYVDTGVLTSTVEGVAHHIKANQCMLYGPNQFHDQHVVGDSSCSYLTVIFQAKTTISESILNRVFACTRSMVDTIQRFVKASDDVTPYQSDEMISALTSMIISMLQYDSQKNKTKPTTPINQHFEDILVDEIVSYINNHLYEPLPIDQICTHFSISRSTLQNLFKNNINIAPKQYINEAKLNHSRSLIRKGDYTISEVAGLLGFNSIHYFSRKFTQYYGITPSEYSRKIYDK